MFESIKMLTTPLVALLAVALVILPSGCAVANVFGDRSAYEEPEYEVISDITKNIQIRHYEPRLVATATVPAGNGRSDDNRAFRLLFDYISGKNKGRQEIAMTTPVEMEEKKGTEIAMTVPVETEQEGDVMQMRFFFPKEFTLETAPAPKDERIKIEMLDAQTYAVYRFSGTVSEKDKVTKEQKLRDALDETNWEPTGDAVMFYYDPPFTLPMFRRNEVVLPVTKKEEQKIENAVEASTTTPSA